LTGIARTPPSPKKSAWKTSATLIPMTAADGPTTIAISVPPTAWAVVPPGIGTLNIISTKQKTDRIARRGIVRPDSARCTRALAMAQAGTVTAPVPSEKTGPR
jgi:hypothetical protein